MACVVCQHCQGQVLKEDSVAIRDGYSYHKKCHKCYVCSETNLHNAEVFIGVIFCSSCSQRIFQACSTARKTKNANKSHSARVKPRTKRRDRRHKVLEADSTTEEARISQERRVESARTRHVNGVLELTQLAASTDSGSSNSDKNRLTLSNTLALSTELALQIGKEIYEETHSKEFKKDSIEMGMTTEVTQELLRQMNCPVVTERKHGSKPASPKPHPKDKGDNKFNKTIICSDLRIAELGASTEIAHMALRKRSEVPVIIKSESGKAMDSLSLSGMNQESDASGDGNEEWLESTYSLKQTENTRWLDRTIGSILKIPYKFFKRNILNRSSLITVMSSDRESRFFLKKLKMFFHEEIADHQSRGVKRLYSTINRRKTPYKLGWLNQMAKVSAVMKPELAVNDKIHTPIRCKHFNRSQSYRCMRAQVMRLAGPTKSELAAFRKKVKTIIVPKCIKDIIGFNKQYTAIMMSQACGSDMHGSSTQR